MPYELKIVSGNSNRPLAEKIAAHMGRKLAECEVSRFSDGELFAQINENVRGTDLFIVQSTNAPADNLMELLIIIDAARRASAARITAVIPYFGYARSDRKTEPRVCIAAKLVANIIVAAGADRVLTMDLHASQIQGFFDIPADHLYSSLIFDKYFQRIGLESPVIVSPDVGSIKMARAFSKTLNGSLAIVDKRRQSPNHSEIMHIIGEVEGRPAIIRDDMVDTAGTLTGAAYAIKKAGAEDIYACCTHGVFSGKSLEKIEKAPIEKMVVSDTIDLSGKELPKKIDVVSSSELFAQAIERIHGEETISELFRGLAPE
jgi:ribose-phosphate pyrophosphokinase